ncbi:uncharacterized protein LOC126678946 [Mercurialis annua]|uniref:uncharacterized protein LOC126678946 n=1 Tax=Mercurialis annua TaxID=3986 RepID=UPI00215EABBE|nr:uncharacterized protein LOC126678946 [Mercurialis annua]
MGERKVINKYYPPDFDAAKLPRLRRAQNDSMKVRMMLPMSVRCNSCGHYIYKGTKFDMIKEIAQEKYINVISIHRFYFRCTHCKALITFKTDPQNSDYIVENGANRNFEPWRAQPEEMDGGQDAMESLENQSLDNKRRMRSEDQLDELKSLKSRQARLINSDTLLHVVLAEKTKKLEEAEEDEALVKSVFGQRSKVLRRVRDDDDEDDDDFHPIRKKASYQISSKSTDTLTKSNASTGCKLPMLRYLVIKKQHV